MKWFIQDSGHSLPYVSTFKNNSEGIVVSTSKNMWLYVKPEEFNLLENHCATLIQKNWKIYMMSRPILL